MYSPTSFCGVIGSPKYSVDPARMAASDRASFPFISTFI